MKSNKVNQHDDKNNDIRLFSYGLNRDLVDEDTFRGLYVANVGNMIGFCFLLALSVLFHWISPQLVWLHFCSAFICLALTAINIKWHNPRLSGRLGGVYFFFFLIASISILGGIHSPTVAWLFVIPLAAGLTIGARDAVFWTIACLFAIALLYYIDINHIYHGPGVPEKFQSVVNFILACFLMVMLGVLLVTGIRRHTLLEAQLAESIQRERDEATLAKILADTASAANEEVAFDRAVKDCLAILCHAQAWDIGHLWLVVDDSTVHPTEIWYVRDSEAIRPAIDLARTSLEPDVLVRRVVAEGRALVMSKSSQERAQWQGLMGSVLNMASQLAWPVFSGGKVTAVIEIISSHTIEFNDRTDTLLTHIALQLSHVRGRERSREDIENMAYSDVLTGLPNRYAFERDMSRLIDNARRDDSQVALMFIDLDGFKRINDSLGHPAGDELLRIVGERLRSDIRPEDIATKISDANSSLIARLGGDEFTVMLQGLQDQKSAELVAQRLLDAVSKPMRIYGTEVSINASIGIAMFPADAPNAAELLLAADAAMYEAKKIDGSSFNFVTPLLNNNVRRQRWLEAEISRGDLNAKLFLEFQTIVDASTHKRVGCEALARWRSGNELIHPTEFIPVAEKTGLIHALGQEIINKAFSAAHRLNNSLEGSEPVVPHLVHVNVSPQQFRDAAFAKKVKQSLLDNQCRPEWVIFEFTENEKLSDDPQSRNLLNELANMGIKFVLDDFGTGYASLLYLRQFPFSNIKIDQGFVRGLLENTEDKAIIQATISMAHALNLPVTAEGVESLAQAQLLHELGCDFLQGNYFGRPLELVSEFAD